MPIEVSQKLLLERYHGDSGKKDIHESHLDFLRACRESARYAGQRLGWREIPCAKEGSPCRWRKSTGRCWRPCPPAGKNLRGESPMDEQDRKRSVVQKTVWKGVSFGSVLAMVISYCNWHSVGWAIFHGLLSWVYVIYYVIRYGFS